MKWFPRKEKPVDPFLLALMGIAAQLDEIDRRMIAIETGIAQIKEEHAIMRVKLAYLLSANIVESYLVARPLMIADETQK